MRPAYLKSLGYGNADLGAILLLLILVGALLVWSPGSLLILPFSLIVVFFVPGYALLSTLYPSKADLNSVQRISGSFGLSTVCIGLLALVASKTIGVNTLAFFLLIAIFTCLLVCVAVYRRILLPAEIRIASPAFGGLSGILHKLPVQDKLIWAIVFSLLITGLAAVRLSRVTSQLQPKYTEFYLLGKNTRAAGYPERAAPGSPVAVTIGVDNHSDQLMDYRLSYQINNGAETELRQLTIKPGELWLLSRSVSLLDQPGLQQIKFILRDVQDSQRTQTLYLWVEAVSAD